MEGGEDKKRRRRPNFSEQELHAMVIAVSEKQDILSGKFYHDRAANTTTTSKNAVWQYVADAVNKLSRVQRDANEVRTKYKHFKSEVKKKTAGEKKRRAGTGGGPIKTIYTAAEEALLKLIPERAAEGVSGFPHGVEVALALEHRPQSPAPREQHDKPNTSAAAVRGPPKKPAAAISTETATTTITVEEWQEVPVQVLNIAGNFGIALEHPYANEAEDPGRGERRALLSDGHASGGASRQTRTSRPPSHEGTLLQILEAQREVRDLLRDLNQTIAKGFNDIAAAIRSGAEGNH